MPVTFPVLFPLFPAPRARDLSILFPPAFVRGSFRVILLARLGARGIYHGLVTFSFRPYSRS